MIEGSVHFVGMGGVGMSALARILLSMGIQVSGSDIQRNRLLEQLESLGAKVYIGHKATHVGNASLVVYSTAIKGGNPELEEAKKRGIPVMHRGELLAMIMSEKEGIAIAGSHGKTTTTSMVASILMHAGLEPTVLVGGRILSIDTNALLGKGTLIIAEADESDGSFLHLLPQYAVVTNVDKEHLDHYGDYENLIRAFQGFIGKVQGKVVVCWDDPALRGIVNANHVTYGLSAGATYRAIGIVKGEGEQSFVCLRNGKKLGRVRITLPGDHNIQNALGALALSIEVGVDWGHAVEALASFKGVDRRLTLRGVAGNVAVVDDYGHHPTEIVHTLRAARERWPGRRIVVVFQPHRYTRTKNLLEEFWGAFYGVDRMVVMEIYPAGESPNGVTGEDVWRGVKKRSCPHAVYIPTKGEVRDYVVRHLKGGDLLLTLGAGDVWKVGDEVLEVLRRRCTP